MLSQRKNVGYNGYFLHMINTYNMTIHFSWNAIKRMTNLSDPTDKGAPRESNQQRVQTVIGISTGAIWSNANNFLRICY